MVFFTCNSCGQSVKKAHVEKHYLTECRNCEVLSCMDCGKDFVGDDYKNHIKCVSENEKYGGKDYRANVKPNKGEIKQSQWIESVQAASSSQSVNPRVKGLLNRLANHNNIPRKKAKFQRFVQNSLKVWDASLIEQIWTVFSEAGNKQQTQPEQKVTEETRTDQEKRIEDNGVGNEGPSGELLEKHSLGDVKIKKKKKHGNQESKEEGKDDGTKERGTDEEECDNETVGQEDCEVSKKKKKKKKDKERCNGDPPDALKDEENNTKGASDVAITSSNGVDQHDAGLLNKVKKKKKHRKNHSEETEGFRNVVENVEEREERCDSESRLEDDECSKKAKDTKKHSRAYKGRHLQDKCKTQMVAETPSSKAAGEGDVGLKTKMGKKNKGKVSDPIPVDGKKRKRSGDTCKLTTSDDTGDSGMDGLLAEIGMDGLICASKKKKYQHKDIHVVTDQGDNSGKNLEKKVKKRRKDEGANSYSKAEIPGEKMKKRKKNETNHKDNIDEGNDSGEKLEKESKKKRRDDDTNPDLNTDNSSGGEKKKTKEKDENQNTEDGGLVAKKTKKLKKRKLGEEGSEAVKSDKVSVKKKKGTSVDVESETKKRKKENGRKKKKRKSEGNLIHVLICKNQ